MAQPTLWSKKTFFYPVGNTTPSCFTQGLAPEKDANVLLLACGDPRSILYTAYAQLGSANRRLDFTCCDWEPAVLARNVLLFSMVADDINPSTAWEIFYHFFLDRGTLDILVAQCRTLTTASLSMETWKASKYGKFLRMCTDHSLAEIRRHWTLYAETAELCGEEKEGLKQSFFKGMQSVLLKKAVTGADIGSATGPLIYTYMSSGIFKSIQSHKELWKTGVTSSELFSKATRNVLNPTFVYSKMGQTFNVHYGTDPVKSFFLAPSLTSLKDNGTKPGLVDVVKLCIEQFSSWYNSFAKRLGGPSSTIVIRFFAGEALAFCHSLGYFKETNLTKSGAYTYPWGGSIITLDAEEYSENTLTPTRFDVVDTSNLTDHCGLLNLLIVTIPLLHQIPSSVIHTDTLLAASGEDIRTSCLTAKVFADIPTLSIFLGITPTSFTSHFSSSSNKHHILGSSGSGQPITWKWTSSIVSGPQTADQVLKPASVSCDPQALADFLFSVYHEMFSEEKVQNLLNLSRLGRQNFTLYQRASLVAFLQIAKTRIVTNWQETVEKFLDLVANDRTFLMGLNNFQELSCQLHLRGIFTAECLRPPSLELARTSGDRLRGWKTIPPVVTIVMKVPRRALKVLENIDLEHIGTPQLQCESSGPSFHNIHTFFRPIFGDIQVYGSSDEPQVNIVEDPSGMDGISPLIVAFYVPSIWLLTTMPVEVGLHLHSTPFTVSFISKFGPRLTIFSTSLTDTENVHITRYSPGNPEELTSLCTQPVISNAGGASAGLLKATFEKTRKSIATLVVRDNITNYKEAESLSSGASVSSRQIADCSILVSYDHYRRIFVFPYPIKGQQTKMRIARKSSYIEVECPIRPNFEDFRDVSLNLFPMARIQQTWNLLNMHYINLAVLPALRMSTPAKRLDWASIHLGMSISEAERELADAGPNEKGPLLNIKESIQNIFASALGLPPHPRSEVIGLHNSDRGGTYTLIFINGVRLDMAAHTILVDASVVPLTESLVVKISPVLQAVTTMKIANVPTNDEEMRAWRMILPVFAERCRTWEHTPNCEYLARGIPACLVLDGIEESPLCSCGKGRDLGAFGANPKWKLVHKEAVRIAIGPLFSFSFFEGFQAKVRDGASEKDRLDVPNPSTRSPVITSDPDHCANCGGSGQPTLQVCSACKKTKYCSRACQTSHWKTHKLQCK